MSNLIINFWPQGRGKGYVSGLTDLLRDELHEAAYVIEDFNSIPQHFQISKFIEAVETTNASIIFFIGSPSHLGTNAKQFKILEELIKGKEVIYWDSDGWGRGKPASKSLNFWAFHSKYFFHSGGFVNPEVLGSSETCVVYTPQTYCHELFVHAEQSPPPASVSEKILFVANNVTRTGIPIPGLTGIDGGFDRFMLATRARAEFGNKFEMLGKGWPKNWKVEPLEFASQIDEIRLRGFSLGWDHFINRQGYYSDRLPISLLSGRAHISNQHIDIDWLTSSEVGYFPENNARSAIERINRLLDVSPRSRQELELHTWEWTRNNLNSRLLARYLLSTTRESISPPEELPWRLLSKPKYGTSPTFSFY